MLAGYKLPEEAAEVLEAVMVLGVVDTLEGAEVLGVVDTLEGVEGVSMVAVSMVAVSMVTVSMVGVSMVAALVATVRIIIHPITTDGRTQYLHGPSMCATNAHESWYYRISSLFNFLCLS